MTTIKYKEKEYEVTDRIDYIIRVLNLENDDALDILESNNYKEGKITESILILYLIDTKDTNNKERLLLLLDSKIYAKGLVSYDVVSKFCNSCYLDDIWSELDHKYTQGSISDEIIKLICKMIEEDNEYISENDEMLNTITHILISEEYEKSIISEQIIKLMGIKNEVSARKIEIINAIIRLELKNLLKDEILKPILEEEKALICSIIDSIVCSRLIDAEEKENYILAMLNVENKENLSNVYNSYLEKGKTSSINEFAKSFVMYTLPLLECGLSYTRKRTQK